MTPTVVPIDSLTFEAAMTELESLVKDLESGKISLEQSITAYERGMALKAHCEKKLHDAQMKIEKIVATPNGSITTEPLDEK